MNDALWVLEQTHHDNNQYFEMYHILLQDQKQLETNYIERNNVHSVECKCSFTLVENWLYVWVVCA